MPPNITKSSKTFTHKPFTFVVVNQSRKNILQSSAYIGILALLKKKRIPHKLSSSFPFNHIDLKYIRQAELMIILGGDGTILSVFKKLTDPTRVKVISVNFGTLGYITSVHERNAVAIIKNYLDGKSKSYKKDLRNLLSISFKKQNYFSLNEMVVIHKEPVRPITINILINDRVTVEFIGDGIIVSTPTGSTAYNLSTRGPILSPEIKAFILSPISPHSLNMKPIVLSNNDKLMIETKQEAIIAIDGQKIDTIKSLEIQCKLAKEVFCLIKPINESHYRILKNKLRWGG